jgi:hypothetical protein
MELAIITPLGEIVEVNDVYKGCRVLIEDYELNVDLIPLKIVDFDVILGMDQLSSHQATMNYYTKVITIRAADREMVNFYGERSVIPNSLISVMKARKLLNKGCVAWLAHVIDRAKQTQELDRILIVKEFQDIFPDELPGLPLGREVEVSIDVFPKTMPISQSPYRIAHSKLTELKVQIQELLDKRFIRPNNSF